MGVAEIGYSAFLEQSLKGLDKTWDKLHPDPVKGAAEKAKKEKEAAEKKQQPRKNQLYSSISLMTAWIQNTEGDCGFESRVFLSGYAVNETESTHVKLIVLHY